MKHLVNSVIIPLILLVSFNSSAAVIRFDTSSVQTQANGNFTLNLLADTSLPFEAISGFNFTLNFDAASFELSQVSSGDGFFEFLNAPGQLTFQSAITNPFEAKSGNNILLASFEFTALQLGESIISVLTDPSDSNSGLLGQFFQPLSFENFAQANIQTLASNNGGIDLPAPSTVGIILLSGLIMLGRRRFLR